MSTLWFVVTASIATSWNVEPLQLVPTLLVAYAYLRRTRTLKRRGQPVAGWRQFLFWLGIGLVVAALNSPIDALGEQHFFFVHMLQHVLLGDLAPLCFVAGLTGPVLRPVLALRPFDRLRFLTHPLVALPIWAVDLYVWHVPFLYDAALHHNSIHASSTCSSSRGGLMGRPAETLPAPTWFGTGGSSGTSRRRLIETVLGNVFIWSNSVFIRCTATPPAWDRRHPRPEPRWAVMMGEGGRRAARLRGPSCGCREGELRQRLLERATTRCSAVGRSLRPWEGTREERTWILNK